jgi:hypothetical protein
VAYRSDPRGAPDGLEARDEVPSGAPPLEFVASMRRAQPDADTVCEVVFCPGPLTRPGANRTHRLFPDPGRLVVALRHTPIVTDHPVTALRLSVSNSSRWCAIGRASGRRRHRQLADHKAVWRGGGREPGRVFVISIPVAGPVGMWAGPEGPSKGRCQPEGAVPARHLHGPSGLAGWDRAPRVSRDGSCGSRGYRRFYASGRRYPANWPTRFAGSDRLRFGASGRACGPRDAGRPACSGAPTGVAPDSVAR